LKKLAIILVCLALAVSFSCPAMAKGKPALAGKWVVPGDFATIQEAVDSTDVLDGDIIFVGEGNHAGAIVTKAVEIKGHDGAVIIDGPLLSTDQPCGTIILNTGFFFTGAGAGSGATISHFIFEDVGFPVFSRGADDVTVTQCVMVNPIQGVTNWSGSGWEISHNRIRDLRSANGGGIGIFIGDALGGVVSDNVVSHNNVAGTLHVAPCDGGGYDGTGIVLYADWRDDKSGALSIEYNRVIKNRIRLVSDNPTVVDVCAIELTEDSNPGEIVIHDNAIGFNNLRGTELQIVLTPEELDECNVISRNLGDNRGHGLHPSVFGPGGN